MHESSMERMRWFAHEFLEAERNISVLDVGSYDVNGCYRPIFAELGCHYIGLDMEAGPNVDIIPESAYDWAEIETDGFDAVVSGQAFEHIEFFWVTLAEMVRAAKKNGLICIIAPKGFEEHRYPVDCWRFFTDGMVALANYYKLDILHAHTNAAPRIENANWFSSDCADSMLIARKPYSGVARMISLKGYKCNPSDHKKLKGNMVSYKEYAEQQQKLLAVNNNNNTVNIATDEGSRNIYPDSTQDTLSLRSFIKKIASKVKRSTI